MSAMGISRKPRSNLQVLGDQRKQILPEMVNTTALLTYK